MLIFLKEAVLAVVLAPLVIIGLAFVLLLGIIDELIYG